MVTMLRQTTSETIKESLYQKTSYQWIAKKYIFLEQISQQNIIYIYIIEGERERVRFSEEEKREQQFCSEHVLKVPGLMDL